MATEGATNLLAFSSQILKTVDQLKAEHHPHGQALKQLEANTRQLIKHVTRSSCCSCCSRSAAP